MIPSTDQQSVSSRSPSRRWDDPPEEEPDAPAENITTMVFIKAFDIRTYLESEILSLTFTPNDTHIAAMTTKATNRAAADPDSPCTLALWSATNGQRHSTSALSSWGLRVTEGFAFKPGTAELAVACPFRYYSPNASTAIADTVYRLEVYSLGRRERLLKQDVGVREPVCWSPDGSFLAGVSTRDPSRLVTVAVGKVFAKVEKVLPRHVDEVTQLAFLPRGSVAVGNVDAVVSAGRDG
jgi:WD40 repeat protein